MLRLSLCLLLACAPALQAQAPAAKADTALAQLHAKGTAASLSILPVRLLGQPFDRVTEVVGLLLEQKGMTALDLATAPFDPGAAKDLDQLGAALSASVRSAPPAADAVLYLELNGSREKGLDELRAVLLRKDGQVLWSLRLDAADLKPDQRNPMALSMLLVEKLTPLFGLGPETAKAARPGPMAARMEARSGLPPQAERDAMPARLAIFKAAGSGRSLAVYPARMNGKLDPDGAEAFTKEVAATKLAQAKPGSADLLLASPQRDPNEQKVLWDLARAFREHLRKNPPPGDYALYADCAFNPGSWEQGFVHVVVCGKSGEWVLVDFQNSHHPDYQAVKPASAAACRALALRRLETRLK